MENTTTPAAALYTVTYWDDEENEWIGHRRFRTMEAATRARRDYSGQTQIVGNGGRVLVGAVTAQRCPDGF